MILDEERAKNFSLGVPTKLGIPLLLGLIAVVSCRIAGTSAMIAYGLAGLVIIGFILVFFVIDSELRVSRMDEQIAAGFHRIARSSRFVDLMERSVLDTGLLTDFLETAGQTGVKTSPLLQRVARREIGRLTYFMRQLSVGGEIVYEGEDIEWLLGLTEEAKLSIDAISLSTVDAGMRGFDGGLWTSDLGTRYLELQREAVVRKVKIRRIFVFEKEELALDETFRKITQSQRKLGIDVRMLDYMLIPELLRSVIFDFIIFDSSVTYESIPAAMFNADGTRPAIVRTLVASITDRVHDLEKQFEQLWEAADPERQIEN